MRYLFVLLTLVLAACEPGAGGIDRQPAAASAMPTESSKIAEQVSAGALVGAVPEEIQQSAEQVAFAVISLRYPNVDAAPVANCIRDNASDAELLQLAEFTGQSLAESSIATVARIADRTDTQRCIIDNGVRLSS